jgi:hypothetical protein
MIGSEISCIDEANALRWAGVAAHLYAVWFDANHEFARPQILLEPVQESELRIEKWSEDHELPSPRQEVLSDRTPQSFAIWGRTVEKRPRTLRPRITQPGGKPRSDEQRGMADGLWNMGLVSKPILKESPRGSGHACGRLVLAQQ